MQDHEQGNVNDDEDMNTDFEGFEGGLDFNARNIMILKDL